MDHSLRTCALQGCDAPLEPTGDVSGDRPQRRYCSAAHRLAARQARRAAAQAAGDQQLAETLPWLREPEAVEVDEPAVPVQRTATRLVAARPAASSGPDRPGPLRAPRSPLRHRRTLALIGATAVLLGGYALATSPSVTGTPAPQDRTADQWAGQARIALAALDDKLGTLNASERTWQASAHETERTPVAVAKLQQQRDTLLQQRAALQSQLQVYSSRQDAVDALAAAEQQLAEMDRIVAALPPATRRTPDQMAAAASLEEQRDLRARNRDACAERLAAIDDGIDRARTAPLPGDGDETEKVADDVLALARGEDPAPPEPSGVRRNPEVLAGGRETGGDRERADVGTAGPPDPRGPLDETRPRAEGPEGASARGPGSAAGRDAGPGEKLGGAVSRAADGVANLAGGAPSPGDGAGSGAGSDAGKKANRAEVAPASSDGPVKKLGDGVGAAARGVGDAAESVGKGVDDVASGLTGKRSGGSGAGGGSGSDSGSSDDAPRPSTPAPREEPAAPASPASQERALPAPSAPLLSAPASDAPAEGVGTERSAAQGSGGSGGIVTAVAGPYVESALGPEAAAPVLAEADRQAAEQMAERTGSSGSRSGGGSEGSGSSQSSGSSSDSSSDGSGSRSSASQSSDRGSDQGSSGSRSSRSSDSGSSDSGSGSSGSRSSDSGSSDSGSSDSGSSNSGSWDSSSDSGSSDSGSSRGESSRSSGSDDSRSSSSSSSDSDSGSRSSGSDSGSSSDSDSGSDSGSGSGGGGSW